MMTTPPRAGEPSAKSPAASRLPALLLVASLLVRAAAPAAGTPAPVAAQLVIPPAEAYVIGDVIPLYWRFTNQGDQPLGFMWEGCCRLNGRLSVTAQGRPIDLIPPGQALAHMFAKAEVLPPGKGRDFDTRLSDWVRLRASGTYTLAGEYVGVRPEQRPQVPRGTQLWREAASTPPIEVTVLSVADYLEQRPRRSAARGVTLELSGSRRLPPLQPSPLQLRLRNAGGDPVRLTWPNDFQLWIVDREGHRPGPGGLLVDGPYEELTVAAGAEVVHPVPFHSDLFEGEPFGDYQVFVDLQDGGSGKPRVPSNPLPVRWELTAGDVATLVTEAAAGPKAGLRNAPLKLLRTYVAELRPTLDGLDPARLGSNAAPLLEQLRLAACLKPSAPRPGRVPVRIDLSDDGRAVLAAGSMADCLGGTAGVLTQQLASLVQVRRHLGWELSLQLEPAPQTPLATVLALAGGLAASGSEWATEPQAVFAGANTNAPGTITFRREPVADPVILRLGGSGPALRLELARRTAPGEALNTLRFEPLSDRASAASRLAEAAAGQLLVLVGPGVIWADVVEVLRPVLARGAQVDLCAAP